jgi:TM2 domain-containing membrane protein YozV
MKKITMILLAALFSFSAIHAGMVYAPASTVVPATTATVNTTASVKKMSKGKLFAKVFKSKLAKVFGKAKKSGDKSKVVAALLAFFLGGFGVHDFYLGNKKAGFIKAGLSLVGLALYIIGIVSVTTTATTTVATTLPVIAIIGSIILLGVSIWAFVDFIRILIGSYEPVDGSYTN